MQHSVWAVVKWLLFFLVSLVSGTLNKTVAMAPSVLTTLESWIDYHVTHTDSRILFGMVLFGRWANVAECYFHYFYKHFKISLAVAFGGTVAPSHIAKVHGIHLNCVFAACADVAIGTRTRVEQKAEDSRFHMRLSLLRAMADTSNVTFAIVDADTVWVAVEQTFLEWLHTHDLVGQADLRLTKHSGGKAFKVWAFAKLGSWGD